MHAGGNRRILQRLALSQLSYGVDNSWDRISSSYTKAKMGTTWTATPSQGLSIVTLNEVKGLGCGGVNAPLQMSRLHRGCSMKSALRRFCWSDFVETLDLRSELSMTFQGRGGHAICL